MKNLAAVTMSLFALLVLTSCSGSPGNAQVVGLYSLDKEALKSSIMEQLPAGSPQDGPGAEMMNKMVDAMTGTIELRPDHTCVLSMSMMGSKQNIAGSWKFEGERLAITATEKGEEEQTRLADYADGAITIEENTGGKLMKMRFSRLPN